MVKAINTDLIRMNSDLINIITKSLKRSKIYLKDDDILAISAKAVSMARGHLIYYDELDASKEAIEISRETGLEARFVEAVLQEADRVLGYDYMAILTVKNDILVINSGLDKKNVPIGYASKWPDYPDDEARWIKRELDGHFGADIGVLIVDSKVMPMRRGTVGFALGSAGINQSVDLRGRYDLYGKELRVTWRNYADDLASTAHLLMGETIEKRPIIVIKDAPSEVFRRNVKSGHVKMSMDECVYMRNLL